MIPSDLPWSQASNSYTCENHLVCDAVSNILSWVGRVQIGDIPSKIILKKHIESGWNIHKQNQK